MAVVGCMWPLVAVVDILLRSLFISFGFAAFMHTYDPLSMTPPSFLLLRTPSTPTLTPTRLTSFSTSLSSLVAFFLFLVARDIVGIHSFFSNLIPMSSFTTPTISTTC